MVTERESRDDARVHEVGYPRGRPGLHRRARGAAALVAGLLALCTASPLRAQSAPPDDTWRTLESEHFRVTFAPGLEELAREAAGRAERAWTRLADAFVEPPEGRTEILLTDHVDLSNGLASVAPYKRIILYARPSVDGSGLSHYDDWLEVVVTHELAHVFHLDVSGPLGRGLRAVFGDVPSPWPFFPQLGTPKWTIEGLATWYESDLGDAGRLGSSFHDMYARTAILEGSFETIDEASGASPVWPAGQRPYVWGSLFFEFLLERYGRDRMALFVEAVGDQWIPYRMNAAARRSFGVSFDEAWETWREVLEAETAALRAELGARRPLTELEPVTRGARYALYPEVSPDGATLVWSASDGRDDEHLRRAGPDGAGADDVTRTNAQSPFSFTPDGRIVFSQLEVEGTYRLFADLWLADFDGGVLRLTEGARLDHPSVTPDGREAVAVQNGGGTTELVAVELTTGTVRPLVPADDDVHWSFPAVSPHGRWVAVTRWSPGAYADVVVLDRLTGEVTEITRDRAMDLAPAWSPDGRWLLWSSDRSGISNVLAVPFDRDDGPAGAVRQVTNVLTGVQWPSVSPDGRWLYVSTYHADGWDVERMPLDPGGFFEPFPLDRRFLPSGSHAGAGGDATGDGPSDAVVRDAPVRGYRALDTFLPRYWEIGWAPPVTTRGVEVMGASWGAVTAAEDLVGRHALDLELLFSTTDARVSGQAAYAWRGLGNPVLSLSAGQWWDAGGPYRQEFDDGDGGTVERVFLIEERERRLSLAATVLRPSFRRSLSLRLAGGMTWERRNVLDPDLTDSDLRLRRPEARLADLRATVGWSTVRSHAFSVSDEDGVSLIVTGRRLHELDVPSEDRDVPLRDRSLNEVVGEVRAFRGIDGPGFADHVLALRASAGMARGPGADAFHYDVGGASGTRETITGFSLFGGRTWLYPVRGFDDGTRSGRQAWSASLEYRVPLALVNAGIGLVPLHLDRIAGTLFADAGNAWGPEEGFGHPNPRGDALASAGAELVVDGLVFFAVPVTVRVGAAARLSGGEGVRAYVRLGRAF